MSQKSYRTQKSNLQSNTMWNIQTACETYFRRVTSQDVTFFYMEYHLSELESCTLILSTNLYFIII